MMACAAAAAQEVHCVAKVESGYLVRGCSCCKGGIHLEPVAEDVQHEQRQEAEIPLPVQDAQHCQEARCREPALGRSCKQLVRSGTWQFMSRT